MTIQTNNRQLGKANIRIESSKIFGNFSGNFGGHKNYFCFVGFFGGIIGGNFGGHEMYFRFGGFFGGITGTGLEWLIIFRFKAEL